MHYEEDPEAAASVLRMVIPTLARLGIPITPLHYALWYEYYLGRSEALSKALEPVSQGQQAYDAQVAERLFREHVLSPGEQQIDRVSEEIKRLLEGLLRMVKEAGIGACEFGTVVSRHYEDLGRASSLNEIRELVSAVVGETRRLLEANRHFNNQLNATSEDITQLRQELAEIRQHVSIDALTGVGNRRAFDEALRQAVEDAATQDAGFCLMMVDVDRFKAINDQHGHLIGDKVIRYVAATLKKMVRGGDFVARFGGEEFAVILQETPEQGALVVAENVRRAVESSKLKRTDTGGPIGTVTVSVGIARYGKGDTPESLVDRADRALYASKKNGRNRVSFQSR